MNRHGHSNIRNGIVWGANKPQHLHMYNLIACNWTLNSPKIRIVQKKSRRRKSNSNLQKEFQKLPKSFEFILARIVCLGDLAPSQAQSTNEKKVMGNTSIRHVATNFGRDAETGAPLHIHGGPLIDKSKANCVDHARKIPKYAAKCVHMHGSRVRVDMASTVCEDSGPPIFPADAALSRNTLKVEWTEFN